MTQDECDIRDMFAGMAMQALVAKNPAILLENDGDNDPAAEIAHGAYEYAEAMLIERYERLAADALADADTIEGSLHRALVDEPTV